MLILVLCLLSCFELIIPVQLRWQSSAAISIKATCIHNADGFYTYVCVYTLLGAGDADACCLHIGQGVAAHVLGEP